jgi:GNAT superfamily N-acetyltransferase
MENLIKPVDYAKKMGISRQAVYAKIKKGLLPSRNVGGKIYIVLEEGNGNGLSGLEEREAGSENVRELLAAKEETIAVLKETIRDLKETNRMITSTLRSEVELLKEAFGEMKTLYAARLERLEPEPIALAELAEELPGEEEVQSAEEAEKGAEREWIGLEEFFRDQGIGKKKLKRRIVARVERLYKKGSKGVRKEEGEYLLTPRKAAKILDKVLRKG